MIGLAWVQSILATLAIALASLALLLPGLKEGFSFGEMGLLLGGAVVLAGVGVLWWYGTGRSLARAAVGLAILALPFLASLWIAGQYTVARIGGLWLTSSTEITDYQETEIGWPGFDGPVGLRVDIELRHGIAPGGIVYSPEIRMGPSISVPLNKAFATLTSGGGYFKDYHLDREVGDLTLLKVVLFRDWPVGDKRPRRLDDSGRSRFSFHLFPGIVDQLTSPDRLCLATITPGLPACRADQKPKDGCKRFGRRVESRPIYHDGGNLSALWLFAGSSDMVGDLSPQLTETLRRESGLQGALEPNAETPGAGGSRPRRLPALPAGAEEPYRLSPLLLSLADGLTTVPVCRTTIDGTCLNRERQ